MLKVRTSLCKIQGSTRTLINVETGELDPLQIRKNFVLKYPFCISVYVTHKVASETKKPSPPVTESSGTRRELGREPPPTSALAHSLG